MPHALGRAWHAIAVMTAAESVGLGQRAMEMAVEYAKDRTQFERPIGTYQAVSHACAQMLLEVEGARSAVLWAAWALDNEPETAGAATNIAKAYASDQPVMKPVPSTALRICAFDLALSNEPLGETASPVSCAIAPACRASTVRIVAAAPR